MGEPKTLSELKSLGPKSQEMLARAGITTVAQLRALGSVAAFVRAKQVNRGVSLNLLWGLESALSGLPWQEVARVHRTSLLLALEDQEKRARPQRP
ncbi:MAG: competence protein TfoX [Curvibacter sp. GWA2_64_110]|nr:MAG: competence protein TfoX [Curvibacter sp. GWA2_64_110]HCY17341.1 competence protein TfoX [Curvibacter sp.]